MAPTVGGNVDTCELRAIMRAHATSDKYVNECYALGICNDRATVSQWRSSLLVNNLEDNSSKGSTTILVIVSVFTTLFTNSGLRECCANITEHERRRGTVRGNSETVTVICCVIAINSICVLRSLIIASAKQPHYIRQHVK